MTVEFTELEIKYAQTHPDVLRAVGMYHELQIQQAQSMTGNLEYCSYNVARQKELEAEANKIESEF